LLSGLYRGNRITNYSKTKLSVDARLESLSTISDFIFSAAMQSDIKQDINKMQLAVDEACTNIMKHAYSSQGGLITIYFERNDNTVVITIRDHGKPFDPSVVPPPDLEAGVEKRQVGKLGLHFIRELMDEVNYDFDPEEGNTLVMKRRLSEENL
jgi:anti-sigma regulatory factor (Ser/Thr protein kinase)